MFDWFFKNVLPKDILHGPRTYCTVLGHIARSKDILHGPRTYCTGKSANTPLISTLLLVKFSLHQTKKDVWSLIHDNYECLFACFHVFFLIGTTAKSRFLVLPPFYFHHVHNFSSVYQPRFQGVLLFWYREGPPHGKVRWPGNEVDLCSFSSVNFSLLVITSQTLKIAFDFFKKRSADSNSSSKSILLLKVSSPYSE